jgi:hypothetical protein
MPWKLSEDRLGLEVERSEPALEVRGERGDIGRVVVIRRQGPHRRLPAQAAKVGEGLVVRRRRRRRAILRVERRDQDALAALGLERVDLLGDGRAAVAHRMVDDHIVAPGAGERSRLAGGDRGERRALVGPHLAVGVGRFPRPGAKDQAAKDRLPDQLRDLDHARIGQELLEVEPDRARLRRVGRAEVDQKHADLRRGDRRVVGGRLHLSAP